MNKINCPNCGAPIDPQNNKCAYCKTSYFDLSAIDLNENKPFYLKIKRGNIYITQLVKLKPDISITAEREFYTAYGGRSNQAKQIIFPASHSISAALTFDVINDGSGNLITMIIEDE